MQLDKEVVLELHTRYSRQRGELFDVIVEIIESEVIFPKSLQIQTVRFASNNFTNKLDDLLSSLCQCNLIMPSMTENVLQVVPPIA